MPPLLNDEIVCMVVNKIYFPYLNLDNKNHIKGKSQDNDFIIIDFFVPFKLVREQEIKSFTAYLNI